MLSISRASTSSVEGCRYATITYQTLKKWYWLLPRVILCIMRTELGVLDETLNRGFMYQCLTLDTLKN